MKNCPACNGKGVDPLEQDPNDWPMGAVVCSTCWDAKQLSENHFAFSEAWRKRRTEIYGKVSYYLEIING